jgi:hypothetical protein
VVETHGWGRFFLADGRALDRRWALGRDWLIEKEMFNERRGRCIRIQLGRLYLGIGMYERQQVLTMEQLQEVEDQAKWFELPANQIGRWRGGAVQEEDLVQLGPTFQAPAADGGDAEGRSSGLDRAGHRPGDA